MRKVVVCWGGSDSRERLWPCRPTALLVLARHERAKQVVQCCSLALLNAGKRALACDAVGCLGLAGCGAGCTAARRPAEPVQQSGGQLGGCSRGLGVGAEAMALTNYRTLLIEANHRATGMSSAPATRVPMKCPNRGPPGSTTRSEAGLL